LEGVLERLGTVHDARFDAEERQILEPLSKNDAKAFESGHMRLGRLLGYDAGNESSSGAPDPWWIVDEGMCFVFEDHSDGKPGVPLSVKKARQASTHPDWVRQELPVSGDAEIIPVLVSPVTSIDKGAQPHLASASADLPRSR
jgi:hypothetical protein